MRRRFVLSAVAASLGLRATADAVAAPLRVAASDPDPFDRDVLASFARTEGRTLEWMRGRDDAVERGSADVVAGEFLDRLPERLVATREVLPSRLVALTRRPAGRATAIESLRWSRIGVAVGSRAEGALRDSKVSGAEALAFDGIAQALSALRAGEVKALLWELPEALLARTRDRSLDLGVCLGARRSRIYAVGRGEPGLLRRLDAFLGTLRSTPSWAALVVRHYGPDALEVLARAHLTD